MLPNLGTRFFIILVILLFVGLFFLIGGEFNLGLDIKGGTSLIYHVPDNPSKTELDEIKGVMSERVDRLALKEISITTDENRDDILIELPGMDETSAKNVKNTLLELGKLLWAIEATEEELKDPIDGLGSKFVLADFMKAQEDRKNQLIQNNPELYDESYTGELMELYKNPADFRVAKNPGDEPAFIYFPPNKWKSRKPGGKWKGPGYGAIVHMGKDMNFYGKDINKVYPTVSQLEQVVFFELRPERKNAFRDFTKDHVKRNLCIIFNEKLVTRPVINTTLPGSGIIQGIGEREEIRKLIVTIKSGSLKIKPILKSEDKIGPTLGEDALRRGILAILLGSVLVLVFMVWIYRVGGILANLALLMNLAVLLSLMLVMDATLSLPSIAGIILTVGIAVDANILIFERVREERDKGKTFIQSLKNGYDRATVTILDANITTLITGLVLYMFGTREIKGFAFVLIAGLIINLFTAIYMTKTIVAWLVDQKRISDLKVVRLFKPPSLDFLAGGKIALVTSLIAVTVGLIVFFGVQGRKILGIDFTGGALMRVQLKEPMEIETFRELVQRIDGSGDLLDVVTVKGRATTQLESGTGSTIFEVKKSIPKEKSDKEAEVFFSKMRKGLEDKLVGAPIVHHPEFMGVNGDDPGRIPGLPQGQKQPTNETERLLVQCMNGFRFRINFYNPTAQNILESALKVLGTPPMKVTPLEEADAEGRFKSYEVWVQPGPFATKKLDDLASKLASQLKSGTNPVNLSDPIPHQKYIGAKVAGQLVGKAILAILVAIVALIFYIRIRFHDITFGLGASAALVHDVLITKGAIAVFDQLGLVGVKISLPIIAAFLTIIGYSLNDTIVIFDRLRENLTKKTKVSLKEAMNQSITQSLTRTFFTSVTTFLVVSCLFVFNFGERGVLEGLGFALMVGVITGTYSTIFIACPVVLMLNPGRSDPVEGKAKSAKG